MKKTIFACLLLCLTFNVMAVPAFPEKILFNQPGTDVSLHIYLKGDERVHWAETEDGYSLLHRDDGCLVYAMMDTRGDMVCSNLLAHDKANRCESENAFLQNIPTHLRFSKEQINTMLEIWRQVENAKKGPKTMSDVIGQKKFLVILFGFSDKEFTYGRFTFRQLFNQVNYTLHGQTGSVRDYYSQVSHGLFSLTVDVVGPFIGTENTAYYGDSDDGYQHFAHEAVDSAAKYVDFSQYDNDGDGYIDGLHIIFAGYGEEAGGGSDCIWSHKWNIFDAPIYNNTVIDVYSCSPELNGNMGSDLTNIGVICHELGHVFGAPDFYDTDYAGSGGEYPGLGQWDIMSSGSWNRNGKTPAHHNPYTKIYIYHWATCDTIDATPSVHKLEPVDRTNADFHRVNTSTEGDFFLIENRQKIKWDNNIPGHGMLVYHIHPTAWGNYKHPQQIYILAQSQYELPINDPSSYGMINSTSTTFPGGYANRDSLTDNTTPSFKPWSGQNNNIPISYISENTTDKTVFFSINKSPDPLDAEALGLNNSTIALNWTSYGSFETLVLINSENDIFGVPNDYYSVGDTVEGGGIVAFIGTNDNLLLDSLIENHQYYFKAFSRIRGTTYSDGIAMECRTLSCEDSEWRNENFQSTLAGELPSCWTGTWKVTANGSEKVLTSPTGNNSREWQNVITRPLKLDSTRKAVLHFRLSFGEGSDQTSKFKLSYHQDQFSNWTTILEEAWQSGMETWKDIYVTLPEMGQFSQIKFSSLATPNSDISIDDVEIDDGSLIFVSCGDYGTIEPDGNVVLNDQENLTISFKPSTGGALHSFSVDNTFVSWDHLSFDNDGWIRYNMQGDGNNHTIHVEFEPVVSIENADENPLRVYPNPTEGLLTIDGISEQGISIHDISGRKIMENRQSVSTITVDLSELEKGIYFIKNGARVIKVVKR